MKNESLYDTEFNLAKNTKKAAKTLNDYQNLLSAKSVWFSVTSAKYQLPGTKNLVPGSWHLSTAQASRTKDIIPGTWQQQFVTP